MREKNILVLCIAIAIFLMPSAMSFEAELDKNTYITNATLTITGVTDYETPVDINATVYNNTGSEISTLNTTSDISNLFTLSTTLTDYAEGTYYINVIQNYSKNITIYFRVVDNEISYKVFIANNENIFSIENFVNYSSDSNNTNLEDLYSSSSISISGTVKYTNTTIDGDKYYFVLVDPDSSGIYNTVLIDDDDNFSLYNTEEDTSGITEKQYKQKSIFKKNNTEYVIGSIDLSGERMIMGKPFNTSRFTVGQTVYFLIITEDANGESAPNEDLTIKITDPDGVETNQSNQTNSDGFFIDDLTLASVGTYLIDVNNGMGIEFVNVESFKISVKTTDLSDSAMSEFSPGATVRINLISKDNSNSLINLTSISMLIIYPNGTQQTITEASFTSSSLGNYYYDFETPEIEGSYALKITAVYSGETQELNFGFSAESTTFDMFAINTAYLEDVDQGGEGVFVDAFAPGVNITVMAVQSDQSLGGFMNGGAVDIENTTANITCNDVVSIIELSDEKDRTYPTSSLDYIVRSMANLSAEGMLPENANPPDDMMQQCMIIIRNNSLPTGFYNLKAKLKTSGTEKINGASFSIQRLTASGYTVDKNGENFGFFSPDTTVNIKIKLQDMITNELLNASQIMDIKIIDAKKEWPTYSDVLLQISNESYNTTTGTLNFIAPNSEGFFSIVFRFKANISDTIYEGEGDAFFELKKYIIFAQVSGGQGGMMGGGSSFQKSGVGENISLTVNIVDISKGSLFDIGMSAGSQSQMSCTGCTGLIATVSRIRNEQLFKEISTSAYTIVNGSVLNSTSGASITITQNEAFDSGFYGLELLLVNPENENETYMGWGFFEIRNFFVQLEKVYYNASDGTFYLSESDEESGGGGKASLQYETGSNMYVLVSAMIPGPNGGDDLEVSDSSIMNILKQGYNGPPTSIDISNSNILERNLWDENCTCINGNCNCTTYLTTGWIANITPITEAGMYMASIRATTDLGSDIGTAMITIADYQLDIVYRDSDTWNSLFSTDEYFNVTLNASDFTEDGSFVGRDLDTATLEFVFSDKGGKPMRIRDIWNSTTDWSCSDNICNVWVNLSTFTPGRYEFDYIVNDTQGNEQTAHASIEVRTYLFSIPQLFQVHNWQSDTADTGSINLQSTRDECENVNMWLASEYYDQQVGESSYVTLERAEGNIYLNYINDTCPDNDTHVCFSSSVNLSEIPLLSKTVVNYSAYFMCLNESNGFVASDSNCGILPGFSFVALATNSTSVWIKYNVTNNTLDGSYNMSGAVQLNASGNSVSIGERTWTVTNIARVSGADYIFDYKDSKIIVIDTTSTGGNIRTFLHTSQPKAGTIMVDHFCYAQGQGSNGIINDEQFDGNGNACQSDRKDFYIAMNSTHSVIANVTNATVTWTRRGPVTTAFDFAIIGVGYDSSGNVDNITRILTNGSNFGKFTPNANGPETIGSPAFIIIPDYYVKMRGNVFCVFNDSANGPNQMPRQWRDKTQFEDDNCPASARKVFVFTNGTHVWFSVGNSDNNASDETAIGLNQLMTETIWGLTWQVSSVNVTQYMSSFSIKLADKICGNNWICNGQGPCQRLFTEIIPPQTDAEFAFGTINLITNPWGMANQYPGEFESERYVIAYHNKTHLYITNTTGNFTGVQGKMITETVNDPYGGIWTVKSLGDNTVSLKGTNVLGGYGAWINMSKSLSGTVRLGTIRESELGVFKMEGDRAGTDIDNDGSTNGTFFYALSDANTAGLYDTFYFSRNSTFNNPISLSGSIASRTFVNHVNTANPIINTTLTILSVDPRADKIILYTSDIGDWSDLGDLAINANIRIPIIVRKPSGSNLVATIKSPGAYQINPNTGERTYISFTSIPTTTVTNGINEIIINSTNTGYNFSSNEYLFEVIGNTTTANMTFEEWRWPRANLKAFLTTNYLGKGGWINNFSLIYLYTFSENKGVRFLDLSTQNMSQLGGEGLLYGFVDDGRQTVQDRTECDFESPNGANETIYNSTTMSQQWQLGNPIYYYYFSGNESDVNRVWISAGDCNFSDATAYVPGDYINVTNGINKYMLQVLAVNNSNNNQPYAYIGVNITNLTAMKPTMYDSWSELPRWKLGYINISNHILNGLFVNSTTNMMCGVFWGDCMSGVYLSSTGNYDGLTAYSPRDQLTISGLTDYYVAGIGPNSWEGLTLINNSAMNGITPIIAGVQIRDNSPLYLKFMNETVIDVDVNIDNDLEDTYYLLVYDGIQDGSNVPTNVVIDDDDEITPEWQSFGEGSQTYYDYTDIEYVADDENHTGLVEQWGNLPSAIWNGNLDFGPQRENESYQRSDWQERKSWNILTFDYADTRNMLINKEMWCGIGANDTLKIFTRAYYFNQTNIANANISLNRVFKFSFMGGGIYNTSKYTSTTALTQSTGYGLITVVPNPSWEIFSNQGDEYIFKALVNDSTNTATAEKYTRIGGVCSWY